MFSNPFRHPDDVLLLTLDSCRFDTFQLAHTPALDRIGPLHKAQAPSYFTYGSHAAIWMGFTPGLPRSKDAWLNPKRAKLFRMQFSGASAAESSEGFVLQGANIIEGFRRQGYLTLGSGAVAWFDPSTETGAVLGSCFEHFFYPGNTWSLQQQLAWLHTTLQLRRPDQPVCLFLNVGETHVPYWYEGAPWPTWPSPCVPFGGTSCSRRESRRRQRLALQWVDAQLYSLIDAFSSATMLACADHGDCWGEDGLWEHGISHPVTLTVPLLMRVHGRPIGSGRFSDALANGSRKARRKLDRWARAVRAVG